MTRRAVAGVLIVLLGVLGSTTAAAQTPGAKPAEQNPQGQPDAGACPDLPEALTGACEAVTGAVREATSSAVSGAARTGVRAVVGEVIEFAAWITGEVGRVLGEVTGPHLSATWFRGEYAQMMVAVVPFLFLALVGAVVQALMRGDLALLGRSVGVFLPLAAVGMGAGAAVVDLFVVATDALSALVARGMGADLTALFTGLGGAVTALGAAGGPATAVGVPLLAGLFGGGLVAFAGLALWVELLLRQAAIYATVLFLPLGFAALVWPATSHWLRRLVQVIVALVLSKLVIVMVLAGAAGAANAQVGREGFAPVLAGGSLLLVGALMPYLLLALIHVGEVHATGRLEGALRRPTAAVSLPQAGPARMLARVREMVTDGQPASNRPGRSRAVPAGRNQLGPAAGDGTPRAERRAGGTVATSQAGVAGAPAAGVGTAAGAAGVTAAQTAAAGAKAAQRIREQDPATLAAATGGEQTGHRSPPTAAPSERALQNPPPTSRPSRRERPGPAADDGD